MTHGAEEQLFQAIDSIKEQFLIDNKAESLHFLHIVQGVLAPSSFNSCWMQTLGGTIYGKILGNFRVHYISDNITIISATKMLQLDTTENPCFETLADQLDDSKGEYKIVEFEDARQTISIDSYLCSQAYENGYRELHLKARAVKRELVDYFFGPLL